MNKNDGYFYCCQCTDKITGKVGCFVHRGDFRATSEVFSDLADFYNWARANRMTFTPGYNWEIHPPVNESEYVIITPTPVPKPPEVEPARTIEELLARYPDMVENSNVLTDIACPHCGNREMFQIDYKTMGLFSDMGEEQCGYQEWDGFVRCNDCDHEESDIKNWTFPGLDAALAKRRQDTK